MGEEARRYQPGAMRASDADRDAVLAELSKHFQAGRLTIEEFDERSDQALRARTYGELADLTKDLPAPARLPAPSPQRPRAAGPQVPVAAFAAALALVALVVVTVASGHGLAGAGNIHLWWLLLVVPFIAARAGRRGR